jgi:MSHA biogenesis protein MshP
MTRLHRQRGLGLPAAIFVITLLAVLAVAINALVAQNDAAFEEEVLLTRAFYAAESGAGFGLNALFPPQEFPGYATGAGTLAGSCAVANATYTLEVPGLNACTAAVSCVVDASVAGVDYYTITSVGTCAGVGRTVQVRSSFEP